MNMSDLLEFRIQNKLKDLKEEYDLLLEYLIALEDETGIESEELKDRLYDIKIKMFLLQDIIEGK